ncbi:MAG TPA: TMEM175 family protein [Gallionellaceae bacterium]
MNNKRRKYSCCLAARDLQCKLLHFYHKQWHYVAVLFRKPGRQHQVNQFMHEESETARIEAFSDGVFAIAITLLVLSIKVPNPDVVSDRGLAISLAALWPAYLAFFTSFVTVLVIWVQHHWIFTQIRRADHPLLYWNGLLLLFVTFVPFPTGLLAEYLLHPEAKVAASLYTGNFLIISVVFHGLWRHVSKSGGLLPSSAISSSQDEKARITKHYQIAPLFYLAAFGLSFVSEIAGISSCLLVAFFFALRGWPTRVR